MARPLAGSTPDDATGARGSISTTAVRLFICQGYDSTTVEQIAREAGSSRATVFRHFRSKEDILFHRYDRELRELCASVQGRKGSAARRARDVLLELAARLEADADAFRLELQLITGNPKLRSRALVMLHAWAGVLAGELVTPDHHDGELPARVLAHSGVAALQEAICLWGRTKPGTETSLVDLATEALRIALPAGRRV